jgi:hypothetical protein
MEETSCWPSRSECWSHMQLYVSSGLIHLHISYVCLIIEWKFLVLLTFVDKRKVNIMINYDIIIAVDALKPIKPLKSNTAISILGLNRNMYATGLCTEVSTRLWIWLLWKITTLCSFWVISISCYSLVNNLQVNVGENLPFSISNIADIISNRMCFQYLQRQEDCLLSIRKVRRRMETIE